MENLSLTAVFTTIKRHKILLTLVSVLSIALGVTVALGIPKQYKSTASLAAESNESSVSASGLSSLASMAGVNIGKSSEAIVPELYPDVVVTNDFLVNILKTKVKPKGAKKSMPFIFYLQKYKKEPWWSKEIHDLVSKFSKKKKKEKLIDANKINPQELTKDEDGIVEGLKGKILCTIDKENSIINIQAYDQDPYVAKQLVETVTAQLQTFIKDYRTSKARVDVDHYKDLEKQMQKKYDKVKKAYADYSDTHQDLTQKSYIVESNDLENNMQLAYNELTQVKQQVTLAEAKLQERTPAFSILEKACVPPRHDSPKKSFIVAAYFFVFFFGTLCILLLRDTMHKEPKEENKPSENEKESDNVEPDLSEQEQPTEEIQPVYVVPADTSDNDKE